MHETSAIGDWQLYFATAATATAALAGLVFVGVSVSLAKLLEDRHLPGRALEAIVLLTLTLTISLCALVPTSEPLLFAIESGACIAVAMFMIVPLQIASVRHVDRAYRGWIYSLNALSDLSLLLYVAMAAGLVGYGWGALPLALPAAILTMLVALANAWIVLVEINR